MSSEHEHKPKPRKNAGGADDGAGLDWFKVFDIAVWVAVGVIVVIALEWFIGTVVRESIASGASGYLKRVNAAKAGGGTEPSA